MLIDLINDYKNHKNIYSRNNNLCLGVYEMYFMSSVTFKNYCYYESALFLKFKGLREILGYINKRW